MIIALYAVSSCKSKKPEISTDLPSHIAVPKDSSVHSEIHDSINYVQVLIDSILIGKENYLVGESIYLAKEVPELYRNHDYRLLWDNIKRSDEAIKVLIEAWKEGLNPKDYHLHSIFDLKEYVESNPDDKEALAKFDILLTDALLTYASHLTNGRLNPKELSTTWNLFSRNIALDAQERLIKESEANNLSVYLEGITPQTPTYLALKNNVIKYTNIIHQGAWKSIPMVETIRPGDSTIIAPMLRERLQSEGFNIQYDSSLYFDKDLVDVVKAFQKQSDLKADGVIGKHTIKALNESAESKRNKIRVNMERSRWVLEGELNEFIVINIAAYQMFHLDSGEIDYTSKVMVGTDETQTPVFRDLLQYIIFNPTWTLPTSISTKEILPKLKRDSLYLQKHNMVIINAKEEIQSDSGIVWADYDEEYFPFILRQQPGPRNSLGRVKFLFPNEYAIYLHDTPSRYLFAKEERAFSHGCIRLQDPLEFAEFLLAKEDTLWTMDSIQTIIDSAQTTSIRLNRGIPIYLMYWTAGADINGDLFFVPDIYGRDERVLKALGKPLK